MFGTSTIRGLSILCAVLSIGLPGGRSEASDDPWPLVNVADLAAWGTFIHSSTGSTSRLLVILPEDEATAEPSPIRLADHVVGLPEGTEITLGARGLYLATIHDPRGSEFSTIEGTILVGGFLAGWPEDRVRTRIRALVSPTPDASPFSEADALVLLESEWLPARLIAIGWWRERGGEPSATAKAALDASLSGDEPRWLRPALELYLIRGWAIPTAGLVDRFITTDDPVLADLALRGIAAHGRATDRADLLLAWHGAETSERVRLLEAYATLQIAEARPWWEEALTSDYPELTTVAVRDLGRAGVPGAARAYQVLLEARDPQMVSLALEGLARTRTPQAAAMLRAFRDSRSEEDPLAEKAERLLTRPHRYGARRPHPSMLDLDGR